MSTNPTKRIEEIDRRLEEDVYKRQTQNTGVLLVCFMILILNFIRKNTVSKLSLIHIYGTDIECDRIVEIRGI